MLVPQAAPRDYERARCDEKSMAAAESFEGAAGIYIQNAVFNTEEYDRINENEFKSAKNDPLSTFSIDVDKASYSNIRRFIQYGQLPPKEDKSKLIVVPVIDNNIALEKTSDNFRFSAAVAGFGILLRDSKFKNDLTYNEVIRLAKGSKGKDENGYRTEFLGMVESSLLMIK